MRAMRICPLFVMAGALFAQHGYSPADIDAGGRLYRSTCVNCHGADGASVPGVDFAHGKFRRASSDDDLARIIITGIPGTPMPPSNFSPAEAETIVAYVRSLAGATTVGTVHLGDPSRGKVIFEGKGQCLNCHRVADHGSRVGPDLTDIGALRRPSQLEQSLVDPNAEIRPENRSVRAVTRDGATITGRLLTEDTFNLQILDSHEKLLSLPKGNLREYHFEQNSPMPSYKDRLSPDDLADVVGYMVSLKGIEAR